MYLRLLQETQSLALLTDLYQLIMAQAYWRLGMADKGSCFHVFFRRKPFQGSYAVVAGIESILHFIQEFCYTPADLDYLKGLLGQEGQPLFKQEFLQYLSTLRMHCTVEAMEEGSIAFPYEPMVRVTGPLLQAQLLETPLLNLFNFQTLIATKAARICLAAFPDPVIEFGVRRAQGIDGALSATRSAYVGGCHSTSNVLGGQLFNIPVSGTQAHSWVMAHETEEEAFENFAKTTPGNCAFLIDTYNSMNGARKAIEVAQKMKKQGINLIALRIDSGDLADLSMKIRQLLDQAGMQQVKIMATNELDEFMIRDLKQKGAKINLWGVGTNLVTGKDQPALDGVYKLAALKNKKGQWERTLKISESLAKVTDPGILQILRFKQGQKYLYDVIVDECEGWKQPVLAIDHLDPSKMQEVDNGLEHQKLLIPMIQEGRLIYQSPSVSQIRIKTYEELSRFDPSILRFLSPSPYFVGLEKSLYDHKLSLIETLTRPEFELLQRKKRSETL
jgi:nicotinate phosphoribosyltransferase